MSGESSKSTPGTKRKGAPGAKPRAAVKKAKNDPKSRDEEVESFWNSPSTLAMKSAEVITKIPNKTYVAYAQMMMNWGDPAVTSTQDEPDVPGEDASEDDWDDSGWSLYVPREGSGCRNAVWFPLYCRKITREDVILTPEDSQWRCKYDPKSGEWFEVPRGMVNGDLAKQKVFTKYMANCVRAKKPGETANCRIVVDWEHKWGTDPEHLRCILVSTQKCEKGHEWKVDIEYAKRMVHEGLYPPALDSESDSEESEEEVVPSGGTTTRPKVAGKAQSLSGFGLPDPNERVATALESHTVLLSLIAERLSEVIARQDEAKEWQEDIKELMVDAKRAEDVRCRQYLKELHAVNLQGAHLRIEVQSLRIQVQRIVGEGCVRIPLDVMQAHANELAAKPEMQVHEDVIALMLPPKPKEAEEGKSSSKPVDVSGSSDDVTPEAPYSPSK